MSHVASPPRPPLTDEQRALAGAHVRLAFHTTFHCRRALEVLGEDDAIGVALAALTRAARCFDPGRISPKSGKPVKFATYAVRSIRQQLLEAAGLAGDWRHRIRCRWRVAPPFASLSTHRNGNPDGHSRNDWEPAAPGGGPDEEVALAEEAEASQRLRLLLERLLLEIPSHECEAIRWWLGGAYAADLGARHGLCGSTIRERKKAGLRRLRLLLEREGVTA